MKQIKRSRIHARFESILAHIGNVELLSDGSSAHTIIKIDGKVQTNIQVLKFVIDARKGSARLYLEMVPKPFSKETA